MRPTRDEVLMGTAFLWAKRSTCSRLHVGAVVSRNGRILAQGYNGAPAGLRHCVHFRVPEDKIRPCTTAIHAELNAIAWSARHGVTVGGAEIHCTDSPCLNCAMAVVNAGITRFSYVREYRIHDGVEFLTTAGIEVNYMDEWFEPSIDDQ